MAKLTQKKVNERAFNKYIRLRDVDSTGYGYCITCGKQLHYKEANAGHFKHGLHFIEDNQHLQCVGCNLHHSGKLDLYATKMIDMYGRERVEELEREKHKVHKYSQSELRELLDYYKWAVEYLKQEKGL